jgi:Zn-dependent peptidase ImmA (M78 family)
MRNFENEGGSDMGYRRGFKSDANWYARQMRRELKLLPYSPLCPWKLAAHLGFPVVPLSTYEKEESETVAFFHSRAGQDAFSAITLFSGSERWIIHNDGHDRKRQAADIAHELAHGLLLHPSKPPINAKGSRDYDAALEAEANWLGPALLVSDEAAVHIVERKMSIQAASDHYGASEQLVRMRLNVSGAFVRVARRRPAA